jgi:hypothetical protein
VLAPWHPAGLLAAQLLAGMCMSALEGDMDARVAAKGSPAASPPVWPRRPPAAPDTCPLS